MRSREATAYDEDDGGLVFERHWAASPRSGDMPSQSPSPTQIETSHAGPSTSRSSSSPDRALTLLPSPVPDDQPLTGINADLYPPTSLLDSLSLISVCLRRPETTARAHDIFRQLLAEHRAGRAPRPEPDVWGSVIEGTAALASPPPPRELTNAKLRKAADAKIEMWRNRARRLIEDWEMSTSDDERSQEGSDKVYQGYVRGLLHSRSSLAPVADRLTDGRLTVEALLPAFKSSERPVLFAALDRLAEEHLLPGLHNEVARCRAMLNEQETRRARQRRVAEIPEVRPVLAKEPYPTTLLSRVTEAGLKEGEALPRFAIANLRATLQTIGAASNVDADPLRRQEILEAASLAAARAELEHAAAEIREQGLTDVEERQRLGSNKLQAHMWRWLQEMTATLTTELAALRVRAEKYNHWRASRPKLKTAQEGGAGSAARDEADLYVYLDLLSPEKLALVTILEVMRLAGSGGITDGMKTLRGMLGVGRAVETEYRAETLQLVLGKDVFREGHSTEREIDHLWRRYNKKGEEVVVQQLADKAKDGESLLTQESMQAYGNVFAPDWTQAKHLAIGSFLVDQLIKSAKIVRTAVDEDGQTISEEQPAFTHAYEYLRGNKQGIIKLNPAVAQMMSRDRIGVVIHPKHMPMLVPPKPWTGYDEGGYLFHRIPVMRMKDSIEQVTYFREAAKAGQLDDVFRGLDVLSSTPWRINENVFNVVLQAWNAGEGIADIPPAEHLAQYEMPVKPPKDDLNPETRTKYIDSVRAVKQQMQKDHSERCKFNYQLEIARSYINDTFYIPHNLDFRGRAYPVPPHLSPVGDDLCRGLLTFAEPKRIGASGLRWLRIHIANLYGYDKASFSDREKFALEHEDEIRDSADHPLDGRRWWLKAEDPWQCLATCFELRNALQMDNPEDYMSSQPVHQDGTCNGMQHYAALGGDVQGAKAVNLDAGDKPSDVYTQVAELVNEVVARDVAKGKPLAQIIEGKVARKVVKQTVMTTVYGVTFIGAKDQIARQLMARGDIPREQVYHTALYLARAVLNCISDLFGGARDIQDWLTLSARLISRSIPVDRVEHATSELLKSTRTRGKTGAVVTDSRGKPVLRLAKELMTSVIWTTPLGLPVVQPYRKPARKQVDTALQSVNISDPNAVTEVSPLKQATAMPPNFIHSLDATHMLMCAARCKSEGLTFASVHDSYWTHAADVDQLSVNIRDTFVDLHSQDIIGALREEFMRRFGEQRILHKSARDIMKAHHAKRGRPLEAAVDDDEPLDDDAELSDVSDPSSSSDDATISDEGGKTTCTIAGKRYPVEKIGGQTFLRFGDLLPPCPPRGSFDVNRIKLSPYFFS